MSFNKLYDQLKILELKANYFYGKDDLRYKRLEIQIKQVKAEILARQLFSRKKRRAC